MNLAQDPLIKSQLKEENLRYFSDQNPGFFRHRLGKKFIYYDLQGNKITDKSTLKRISGLIIPPAWVNVWVSPLTNSHLQATGVDSKERKQYLYHPSWIKICQENKFSKLVDFGLSLPKIRSKVRFDLLRKSLDKSKIIATVIWLLEHTFIRVGNDEYQKANQSYGLTTLRNKHAKVDGGKVTFRFIGKSGVSHIIQVQNPAIAKTIQKCIELPGFELFQYIDEENNRHVIDSEDVNNFLKDITHQDFSAKDFRTWGGTDIAALHFYETGVPVNKKQLDKNITQAVKKVAQHLKNTPKICKNYYIHPVVIETYEQNILIPHFGKFIGYTAKPELSWNEFALIKLLQKHSSQVTD